MDSLREDLKLRYGRQISVKEIGVEGQKKILDAKILIIGCGALGSMIAMQLAGAGIGTIGLIDFDTIDISNLQRQFFYKTEEAGQSKIETLGKRIRDLNPGVFVEKYQELLTGKKAEKLFGSYDFIIDATDNPESKKMIGEISQRKSKPCCIGGISDFKGQVITLLPEDPRFEDYFGITSNEGMLPCSIGGVFGPAAALCASLQTSEVLKYISCKGDIFLGNIIVFNLLENSFKKILLG